MSRSGLRFRNLTVSPGIPVQAWPFEGILTAIERGTLPDWIRLADAIAADPWGPVTEQVQQAVRILQPYGTGQLMRMVIDDARSEAIRRDRGAVADEIRSLVNRSGLSNRDFARRIGTSASRFSTYLSGTVTPSAALLVRMRRVAGAVETPPP